MNYHDLKMRRAKSQNGTLKKMLLEDIKMSDAMITHYIIAFREKDEEAFKKRVKEEKQRAKFVQALLNCTLDPK